MNAKLLSDFLPLLKRSYLSYNCSSTIPFSLTNIIKPTPVINSTKISGNQHLRFIRDILQSEYFKREDRVLLNQAIDTPLLNCTISVVPYNPVSLSNALWSCTLSRDIEGGIQYHATAIKASLAGNSYVGSCLISFYTRRFDFTSAVKAFEEIPVRNVVSWTAIISGFAQSHQNLDCFHLYSMMRKTTTKPNDYTFSSLLSACCGSGIGKAVHGQVILLGFWSHIHVKNALSSMYSKCGCLDDAFSLFNANAGDNDVVSWNAMIAGFAVNGLSVRAIELFEEMKRRKVPPDGITFLAVLSSCRHSGLLYEGMKHLKSMFDLNVNPRMDHYCCIVDMLGRAGKVEEAREVIERMPFPANEQIWGSLLSSCRLHGNVWVGIEAAEKRLCLKPNCASTHVLLMNLYAAAKCWDKVAMMRKLVKERGMEMNSGYSCIQLQNHLFKFRAEDQSLYRFHHLLLLMNTLIRNSLQFTASLTDVVHIF